MHLDEFDDLLRRTFAVDETAGVDSAVNGLQVGRPDPEITTVACAVDACMETFRRAAEAGADILFVHHGLFWGAGVPLVRSHYERVRFLVESGLALYAVHLPLDLHPTLGNNAVIARKLGLTAIEPFGTYHGVKIGRKGKFATPVTLDEVVDILALDRDASPAVLGFGPERIETVGIVSGGATHEVAQVAEERLDLYITGDASHTMYHFCLDESVNLLCGGHYQTEVFGVARMTEFFENETELDAVFIDVPTGL